MTSPTTPIIDKETTVRAASGQISADLGGTIAIHHIESGYYYALNAVGARVWELIKVQITVGEILQALLREYDVAPERCARDLEALLQGLAERGLLEIVTNSQG